MTSKFINYKNATDWVPNTLSQRQQQLHQWLHQCRLKTLALFEGLDDATFCCQAHPDFSPVGWHLGHIAYTESLWILERTARKAPLFPEFRRLFVADGLPKTERVNLPKQAEVRYYLDTVREQVLAYLETADLDQQERLWRWIIQHESQHSETISFVLALIRGKDAKFRVCPGGGRDAKFRVSTCGGNPHLDEMIQIPAGYFEQGSNSIDAMDNECPVHSVYLETYWIDRYPVTCGQYRAFIEAGGYQNSSWWSAAGWDWLQNHPVRQPLYWSDEPSLDNHPVCGVSWYEAEAYAQFVRKRLPTEAEWEKAASWDVASSRRRTYPWGEALPDANLCHHDNATNKTMPVDAYPNGQSAYGCYDMLGNVWEWTASVFQGYEGFVSYPYIGYSQVYFDDKHQVLRGGSWATRPWALRSSFRNWYHPNVRQIIAGFRCAKSLAVSGQ